MGCDGSAISATIQLAWELVPGQRRTTEMHEIREHMKVVDKDGVEVGLIDEVEVSRLKLEKGSDNQHHYVDKELVADVEGNTVRLSVQAKEVKRR
jgi:hypothetical protein